MLSNQNVRQLAAAAAAAVGVVIKANRPVSFLCLGALFLPPPSPLTLSLICLTYCSFSLPACADRLINLYLSSSFISRRECRQLMNE